MVAARNITIACTGVAAGAEFEIERRWRQPGDAGRYLAKMVDSLPPARTQTLLTLARKYRQNSIDCAVQTHFISVEISIHTDDESTEWIQWFCGQDNHVTKNPGTDSQWHIFFGPLPSQGADATIQALCTEIDQLPSEIRQYWTNATRREFFVGYQAGFQPPCFNDQISLSTLGRVVDLQAELRLAIYPADSE